jgi:hypothetical protein
MKGGEGKGRGLNCVGRYPCFLCAMFMFCFFKKIAFLILVFDVVMSSSSCQITHIPLHAWHCPAEHSTATDAFGRLWSLVYTVITCEVLQYTL